MKIKDITEYLESIAPPAYQENYDNSQLITGNKDDKVKKILITLDTTEDVVQEAIVLNCNLIISHHPIIFQGLKSITGKNYVERIIIKAIKNNIAIYALHTNLDNVLSGVNRKICQKIGLKNERILMPKSNQLSKLVVFIPKEFVSKIKESLFKIGVGKIENYENCSFETEGQGQFKPIKEANPFIGEKNKTEKVNEVRLEVILPTYLTNNALKTIKNNHPYETFAYYLNCLNNINQEVGSGMIGELEKPMKTMDFLKWLKNKMSLNVIRYTKITHNTISKVAVCGGSGYFLLKNAITAGADIFISADFKYHNFFDANNQIIIADIGHYESEVFTKELISEYLYKKFANIALHLSNSVTNPINYL